MPATEKNAYPEIQIEIAGAAVLKRILCTERACGFIQNRIVRHSNRTVAAPAEGPKRRTEAKTNVSETERLALMDGTLTVNDPVRRVKPAMISHWGPMG